MPDTAPRAEYVADGVARAAPSARDARPRDRWRRWAGPVVFCLLLVALFDAYLHLSQTHAENSDEANILLMAKDMLHGNVFLSGWHVSDVPFITTELPQMALLVWVFGLRLGTAHISAALTYTLVVAVAMLLAKGKTHGWRAVARMGIALGIMLAPQPGVGVFVDVFSVGHIGTALPVMLTWLVIDRWGGTAGGSEGARRRRWWVPLVVAVLLAWAEITDPLVLVIAIFPMLAVCLIRVSAGLVAGARSAGAGEGGLRGLRQALVARWFELALSAAAGLGYLGAWTAARLMRIAGGYVQQPVPYQLDAPGKWFMQARIVVHGLLEMFGAYFVPGQQEPQAGAPAPGMLDQIIAYSHLVGVVVALWGACAIARRFFRRDADFVSQLLLAGIIANIFAYVPAAMADHSALNTREIAPVLPFAAVLAGRMLGGRLLRAARSGPSLRVRGRAVVRVVVASIVVLTGWYGFGLWRQASAPAAPEPYAQLVSYLESKHLTYGIGGYWESSIITVESGGAVTVRAVTPACLQPYQWESKAEWYDPAKHSANFLLLNNVPGYFSKFSPAPGGLLLLNRWYTTTTYEIGTFQLVKGYRLYQYQARAYSGNVLAAMPQLRAQLENPPPWLIRALTDAGDKADRGGQGACS